MHSVTLFVPGLLGLVNELKHLSESDIPELKNLQRFLSRAEKKSVDIHDWHGGLALLFQLEKLPAAALSYRQCAGTIEADHFYLCADPVYIQPDMNSAVLLAHEELDLSLEDAGELAASVNAHFVDESWSLEVLRPHRWLIKLTRPPLLMTTPLVRIKGRPIGDNLAQGNDSPYWQRILNEIQMLLFAHPLNQQREAEGKLPVNSLWLWGEGELANKHSDWQTILGRGELLDALMHYEDCAGKEMSINDELLIEDSGRSLLASDEFITPVQARDIDAWLQALKQFENNWMRVLMTLLRAGKVERIDLIVGDGLQFSLTRSLSRRWWRRTKPLKESRWV